MGSVPPTDVRTQDTAAIHSIVAAQEIAWNAGDAKALASRYASDVGFTNVLGIVAYGREAFEARHVDLFAGIFKSSTTRMPISKLRLVRDGVAIADIDAELTGFARLPPGIQAGADGVMRTRLQMVFVKERDGWWVTAFHNVAVTPLPAPAR